MIGKLGTVCMTGVFCKNSGKFTSAPNTQMGTITRKSMMQLCGIDDPVLITDELVKVNHNKLKAKLLPKVKQNLNALYNQLVFISKMDKSCHMLRISSDLLPLFDHPVLHNVYDQEILLVIDLMLTRCKSIIDKHDIVVTTHPDQFVIINSVNENVRESSFRTLEYHLYFMSRLTTPEKSSINIHLEGNLDHLPEFDNGKHDLLKPWLSFENSDKNGKIFTGNLDNTLLICEKYNIKLLYDLHHDFVMNGELLDLSSDLFKRIIATWKNTTPIFHVSQSRDNDNIRAHSDFITDINVIDHVSKLLQYGHVEVEAKAKTNAVLSLKSLLF